MAYDPNKVWPRTDWYLVVTQQSSMGSFVEAYGPFSSAAKAADHVDAVIKTDLEVKQIEWSDIELYKFEVMYEFDAAVRSMTENEEIIKPPIERQ